MYIKKQILCTQYLIVVKESTQHTCFYNSAVNNDCTVKSMYCKSPRSNGESANTVCTGCRGRRDSLLQKVISFKKMICQSTSPVFVPSWITDTRSFSVSYIRTHSIIHCYNVRFTVCSEYAKL